jgi:hypothetical protein
MTLTYVWQFLLLPSLISAYSWHFTSTPYQCQSLGISIDGSGYPPYSVLIIPFGPSPLPNNIEARRIYSQNFSGSDTSLSFQLQYPANSQFVAVVKFNNNLILAEELHLFLVGQRCIRVWVRRDQRRGSSPRRKPKRHELFQRRYERVTRLVSQHQPTQSDRAMFAHKNMVGSHHCSGVSIAIELLAPPPTFLFFFFVAN